MNIQRKQVCVQGLGFVGAAMAVAIANARSSDGAILYQVTGIDQDTPSGLERIEALENGVFPFSTPDTNLHEALGRAHEAGNLSATTDESKFAEADIVVIDVPLDISFKVEQPLLEMESLEDAVKGIAWHIRSGTLILVETTVPPGTCEEVVAPVLRKVLQHRGMDDRSVYLAHSFERVMPGEAYLDSITHFWRAYAGLTPAASDACETFLSSIVDVKNYPLTRLSSIRASETAKVMENTYRAVNIAFIDEWTKYAEAVGIDLYEVIGAIQVRPTHSNIRFPGLGVGGYCLTKDPAFAPAAARQLFGNRDLTFPFSELAMRVNNAMPAHTVRRLEIQFGGSCRGKRILLLGISYRQDIGDTRYSPVETLARALEDRGAEIEGYDPYLHYWLEMDRPLLPTLPNANKFDGIVITTPHREFFGLDLLAWLGSSRPIVFDAANVATKVQRQSYRKMGICFESVGRANGL